MGVWAHDGVDIDAYERKGSYRFKCRYCNLSLRRLDEKTSSEDYAPSNGPRMDYYTWFESCPVCGWWLVSHLLCRSWSNDCDEYRSEIGGSLKQLDISNISLPLDELRTYLTVNFERRNLMHPRKFEELVGAIFSDSGHRVRVTSYSCDNGIDIAVLEGPDDTLVGVQVKRYRNKIVAEQIRSFAGALVLGGMTKGVFVTTSSFTKGSVITANKFNQQQLGIELWDSKKLYDRLSIIRLPQLQGTDTANAPFKRFWLDPTIIPDVDFYSYTFSFE